MHMSFVTITVRNMEESLRFYTDILELREVKRFSPQTGVNIVFLEDDEGGRIELIEHEGVGYKEEMKPNISVGFEVDDLDSVIEMLKEKNIDISRGPMQVPSGEKFLFIKDPNGVEIEFIQGIRPLRITDN